MLNKQDDGQQPLTAVQEAEVKLAAVSCNANLEGLGNSLPGFLHTAAWKRLINAMLMAQLIRTWMQGGDSLIAEGFAESCEEWLPAAVTEGELKGSQLFGFSASSTRSAVDLHPIYVPHHS